MKPVIDLNTPLTHDGYEVPDRIAEHVQLRDEHCVFPWCTRAARRCDTDHVIPWPRGSTTTDNLAALCRRHHRLKTHSTWTYTMLDPGSYLWSSPHGYQLLVDHTGTTDISRTTDHRTSSSHAPHPAPPAPGGDIGMPRGRFRQAQPAVARRGCRHAPGRFRQAQPTVARRRADVTPRRLSLSKPGEAPGPGPRPGVRRVVSTGSTSGGPGVRRVVSTGSTSGGPAYGEAAGAATGVGRAQREARRSSRARPWRGRSKVQELFADSGLQPVSGGATSGADQK